MTKWKCDRADARCFKPCYAEIECYEGMPLKCLFGDARTPKWERVPDKPEQKQETELPDWCKVGEWAVHEFYHEYSKQNLYNIYWSKDGEEVAERVYSKADAHLMAASKEMYGVLKRLVYLTDYAELVGVIHDAKAVLKKVRGEG